MTKQHVRLKNDDEQLPQYRPDVDGLRAVADVAVIVYHFDETILPGGFVGVDIFFVISGYPRASTIH